MEIFDSDFWRRRLAVAVDREKVHHAVFVSSDELWWSIAASHRRILAAAIGDRDSVLDVGCGWGRLLSLMPHGWEGEYLGVDIAECFVDMARTARPCSLFALHDARKPMDGLAPWLPADVAVLVSVRSMVLREKGREEWERMERNVRAAARSVLYLEYDPGDPGSLE